MRSSPASWRERWGGAATIAGSTKAHEDGSGRDELNRGGGREEQRYGEREKGDDGGDVEHATGSKVAAMAKSRDDAPARAEHAS